MAAGPGLRLDHLPFSGATGIGPKAAGPWRDIAGRLGVEPAAIVEAVEDALAGRRPRR